MKRNRFLAVMAGRTACIAALGLALNAAPLAPRDGHGGLMGRSMDAPRAGVNVDGPVLVLGLHAPQVAIPPYGPLVTSGDVLALRGGKATVVMRGVPAAGQFAPSPDGRYLAFARGSAGLWVSGHDGTAMRRIVEPPPTGTAVAVGVGAVAWSPDGSALAYALNPLPPSGEPRPRPRQGGAGATGIAGLWVVHTDGSGARMLAPDAGLAAAGISRLSWSSDGRALAVSATRSIGGRATPVVLAVDAASGQSHLLVAGATDGVYAPASAASATLAYVLPSMGAASGGRPTVSLHVVDTQTRHDRALVNGHDAISSPVWAPDGRTLAYIQGPGTGGQGGTVGTDVRTVDVATGQAHVVLTLPKAGAYIRFSALAWPRATS